MQKPDHHELVEAEMIHQRELIVGVGIPGPVDLERAGGLAGRRIAQVECDATVLVAELLHGMERRIGAGDILDVRVQPAARDQQQREAGAGFLVMDADGTLFKEGHGYAVAGRCARRKECTCRSANGMRSFGCFHGNIVTSAFGASIAASIATA